MAYYHKKCNGRISILRRKCTKCGKTWPISAWFQYPPPKDMTRFIVETRKEPTSYAKWGDRFPFVGIIARALPNWPRWARILVLCILIALVVVITIKIRGL
jgi:hypothetical protein